MGIDPGATGAAVLLDEAGKIVLIEDLPMRSTLVAGRARRTIDEWGWCKWFDALATRHHLVRVAIEHQQPMPAIKRKGKDGAVGSVGSGPIGEWTLARNYQHLRATAIAHLIGCDAPRCNDWRKAAGIPTRCPGGRVELKSLAIARASDLWPAWAGEFAGHDGRAEAALIAKWCRESGGGPG